MNHLTVAVIIKSISYQFIFILNNYRMLEIIHKIFNFILIIITYFKYHLTFFIIHNIITLQLFEDDYS
jgi:hypothetical protein